MVTKSDGTIERLCDEIREETEDGNAEFDLEGAGAEDYAELGDQLVNMIDAAENLIMVVHRTLMDLSLSKKQAI